MKNILVTGANGQLGQEIKELVDSNSTLAKDFNFIFASRQALDIGDSLQTTDFFANNKIDFCINCAAYTAVDQAETDKENCYEINALAVELLAKECLKQNAILIQISTDYVFNGSKNSPYLETDVTNPINYYGKSKLAGEQLAIKNNSKTIIIRTSWLYSKKYGKNFYKTILRLATEKPELKIVADQIGCPTDAADLSKTILQIITKIHNSLTFNNFGIYHFSGNKISSWYDFAKKIVSENNLVCEIFPIPTSEYPTPAKRPLYSVMNSTIGSLL